LFRSENVSQAVSALRPNMTAGYSRGKVSTDRDDSSKTTLKTANATQPLFVGGAIAGIRGAKQRVKAGQAQLTAVEQQVLFDAVLAYTSVVNRAAVLQVNQNNVDLLNKQFLATKSRFEVGEITRTDLAQAQSRLASAQANERTALGQLDVDRATFRRVIGFDAPSLLALPPEPADMPTTLEEARREAESNEPTLKAALQLQKASESDVGAFKGALLPSANFVAARREVDNTVGGSQAISNDSFIFNVTVPLYQSGAEWSRVRQARDLAQRASYVARDTQNAVVQAVTQAWENYVMAKAVITSNEDAVRAAKTAVKSIQQENKFGTRTILDVLNTQQDMVNAQVNLVNARVSERQAAYRLLAAMGHLTAESLGLPVDINDPDQHYDRVKYKLIGF
ncbi:MAG: TolC family outer membrane protein, partial [Rickettsiales bacterium]|nr:TolC family outer membrane protein [Rickettsiales bacterium]